MTCASIFLNILRVTPWRGSKRWTQTGRKRLSEGTRLLCKWILLISSCFSSGYLLFVLQWLLNKNLQEERKNSFLSERNIDNREAVLTGLLSREREATRDQSNDCTKVQLSEQ